MGRFLRHVGGAVFGDPVVLEVFRRDDRELSRSVFRRTDLLYRRASEDIADFFKKIFTPTIRNDPDQGIHA
jgi:hypothetical protein